MYVMRLILLTSFLTLFLWGGELEWVDSYEEAQEHAINENKPILLLMTAETCRWCRKLESTTLEDDSIADRINAKYISVNVTRDIDSYPPCLKAKMVPKSFFIFPDGKLIIRGVIGYWSVEDYHSIIDDVEKAIKKHEKRIKRY